MGINLEDIHKSFGLPPTSVLKGINVTVNDGEFVAIVGRSGCGKSTLLYILSTLDQPSSGSVEIDGRLVENMDIGEVHSFRNMQMGFVFQFHHLLPELSVIENVLMPALKRNLAQQKRDNALKLINEFGLSDKINRLPGQLSGGEQQRVAIARALVMGPKYIFADEPTGNLDSTNGDIVMGLFKRFNQEQKTTIIYVTHDPTFASLASRQIHMSDGRII
ncbi:MAG: ABC transporter ATP-binding protein [Bdellovibrio sp.]|nr:ABC transporter ATP-binding protein [Bdellovibrio sp.]